LPPKRSSWVGLPTQLTSISSIFRFTLLHHKHYSGPYRPCYRLSAAGRYKLSIVTTAFPASWVNACRCCGIHPWFLLAKNSSIAGSG